MHALHGVNTNMQSCNVTLVVQCAREAKGNPKGQLVPVPLQCNAPPIITSSFRSPLQLLYIGCCYGTLFGHACQVILLPDYFFVAMVPQVAMILHIVVSSCCHGT